MSAPARPAALQRFTFDRLLTTLLFLALAVAAGLMPAQNDTWWQLRAGRDMWHAHVVLLRDTFSHTALGSPWPNHEWLSQAIFYGLYALGGLPLLTLAAAAAVVGAWAIVWRQTPASPRVRFLLIASVVVAACGTWSPRPQVLSLLLTMVTIALLRTRRYAWLPVVFLLWANLHGAVVMGVCLLAAAVLLSLVEIVGARRKRGTIAGKAEPSSARRLWIAAALSIAATFLTPLGSRFWIEIAGSLQRIRQLGIAEWAPPRLFDPVLIPFWLALAALAGLILGRGRALWHDANARRDGRLTLCACALALAPLALAASRNVPPFLMAAVPALAALMPARVAAANRRPAKERSRLNLTLTTLASSAAAITLWVAYASEAKHLAWTPLPRASLAALEACPDNLYNRYDEGGYLIWFAPDRKVFLDGRQDPYSPSLIAEQVRVEKTGNFAETFRRYDIGCAYIPADSILTARLLEAGWKPLYRDERWAVLEHPPIDTRTRGNPGQKRIPPRVLLARAFDEYR
jgi:hypothetical protein